MINRPVAAFGCVGGPAYCVERGLGAWGSTGIRIGEMFRVQSEINLRYLKKSQS